MVKNTSGPPPHFSYAHRSTRKTDFAAEAAATKFNSVCLYVGLTEEPDGTCNTKRQDIWVWRTVCMWGSPQWEGEPVAEVGRERKVCAREFVCAAHRLGGKGDQMILIEHTRLNLSRSCQQGHSTAYNTPCTFSRLQRILLLRTLS